MSASVAVCRRLQVIHRILHKRYLTGSNSNSGDRSNRNLCTNEATIKMDMDNNSCNAFGDARVATFPNPSAMDAVTRIRASGLPPTSPVTITVAVRSDADKINFESKNYFLTTLEGTLQVEQHQAMAGGTYEGIDVMGPFTSMQPVMTAEGSSSASSLSLMPADITQPLRFDIRIWLGHRKEGVEYKREPRLLAQTTAIRHYLAPHVQRIPIREGRVRGTLFVPVGADDKTNRKLPLVITLYGAIVRGRVIEEKAACLAAKGFATLALGFFGVDDLPKRYDNNNVEIEYFEEAIDLVSARDDIDKDRIGILGFSKGGDLTLSCAAFLKEKVKACVILNACIGSIASPTTYKGQRVEAVKVPSLMDFGDRIKMREDGTIDVSDMIKTVEDQPEAIIPFANCPADLLFLVGTDDKNFNSQGFARHADRLMTAAGKTNFEVLEYPGMGHMCNLPYSPPVFRTNHPLAPPGALLYMGGEEDKEGHLKGQKDAWERTVQFFKQKLLK